MATLGGLGRRLRAAGSALAGHLPAPPEPEPDPVPVDVEPEPLPDITGISFIPVADPVVSILIPIYGQLDVTLDCLRSLAAVQGRHSFEVLALDDATPHEAAPHKDMSVLATVPGLRYLRSDTNRGFLGNCNWGAEHVQGRIILLLNNDTLVDPGFLDPLVDTIDSSPTIGAVGSLLVYPDGVVQEAGGIVWSDGSGWNYGRHDPGDNSRNLWLREVDYCSGASLAVRRDLWERLGGFDQRFAPAYYEDTDLCFQLREIGFRVMFQPLSRVVHLEGVSHGTDTSGGIKHKQVENQLVFVEKWAHRMLQQYPMSVDLLYCARVRHTGPRIAIVDHIFPEPDRDSGSVRMSQIVEIFHDLGFLVHFLPTSCVGKGPLADSWRAKGIEVFSGVYDLHDVLQQLSPTLDLVLLSRPHVASRFLFELRQHSPDLPVVYDMVDAHGLRELRQAELENDRYRANAAKANHVLELGLCAAADVAIAISPEEAEMVRAEAHQRARVHVLANIHPTVPEGPGPGGRDGVLFVGGYGHPPNVDAVLWLVEDILPQLASPSSAVLVGSKPPIEVRQLADERVTVAGWVEDLTPIYDTSRVAVAPLRFGAGVKGKIGEALSHGVPTVTTTIGAEGLGLVDGHTALIADTASEFAAAIDRLRTDDVLWQRLATNGREHIEAISGRTNARARILEILEAVGVSPAG
jgi:GT2 family glycosyltransferase